MRPLLLGCAAVAMFIGGVVVAPLTSDIASTTCTAGHVVDVGSPQACVLASVTPASDQSV